jgi:hypothetical protein
MSDAEERLAALDPAANQPYRHADLDAMVSRIVAAPAPSQSAHWQRLQARLAGGLIAASLATALALVATQGAPSLPALAIQRALTSHAPSADFSAAGPMNVYEDLHFTVGPAISSSAPSVASYQLDLPANANAEAARLAALFGVSGTSKKVGGTWTVKSTSGAVLSYDDVGVPRWYFSSTSPEVAPAEESRAASVAMPSHATVQSDVLHYLDELGYHYTVSAPSFSTATTSTTSPDGAPLTVSSETVSYFVFVNGTTTDQSVIFTVDPSNALLYAEGPAFHVASGVSYPLQSPLDAVAALTTAEKGSFAATANPPTATATVTSDTVSLAAYQLKNGTLWLLPLYTYAGSIKGTKSVATTRTWSALAVEPTYVKGSSATSDGESN